MSIIKVDFAIKRHDQFPYDSGRVKCEGELETLETCGKVTEGGNEYADAFICLRCQECGEEMTMPNPKRRLVKEAGKKETWRARKDIG